MEVLSLALLSIERTGFTLLIGYCPLRLRWAFIHSLIIRKRTQQTETRAATPRMKMERKTSQSNHTTPRCQTVHIFMDQVPTNSWHLGHRPNSYRIRILNDSQKFMDQCCINQLVGSLWSFERTLSFLYHFVLFIIAVLLSLRLVKHLISVMASMVCWFAKCILWARLFNAKVFLFFKGKMLVIREQSIGAKWHILR